MQTITTGYGKVTFATASASVTNFVLTEGFVRTLSSKILGKNSVTRRIPATEYPDINGWLYADELKAPEGTILLLQMRRSYRGRAIADGAIIVRTREDGDTLLISSLLPSSTESLVSNNTHTVFMGRGDMLTPEEVKTYGVHILPRYIACNFDEEEISECFQVQVIKKGVDAPVYEKAVSRTGEQVVFSVPQVRRRIRIRKA